MVVTNTTISKVRRRATQYIALQYPAMPGRERFMRASCEVSAQTHASQRAPRRRAPVCRVTFWGARRNGETLVRFTTAPLGGGPAHAERRRTSYLRQAVPRRLVACSSGATLRNT